MRNFLNSRFVEDVRLVVNRTALTLSGILAFIGFLHVAESYPNASYLALTIACFVVAIVNRPTPKK